MKMKKLMIMMLTVALLLAATGCAFQTPQEAQEGPVEIAEPQEGTPTPTDQEKPVEAPEKPVEGSETNAKGGEAQGDAKTDDAEKKDDAAPAGGEDQDTGDSTQGNTTQGGSSSTGSSAQSNKGYDNGSLTAAQVKEMQRWYGIGADGQWGPGSKAKAGGLDADAAWAKYQTAKAASNNQGGSGQGNTGNGGNGGTGSSNTGNTGSGVIGGSHTVTPKPQPQPTPQQPVHVHTWVPVYEVVEVTETQTHTFCSTCEADLTAMGLHGNEIGDHCEVHALNGEGAGSYEKAVSVVTGTETQIVGYKCSECGEWE